MKFRRRQRWLRRFALAFAFATALVAGRVSPAWAKFDDGGTSASTVPYVSTGNVASTAPSGDEIAIANAMAERNLAKAEKVHDPYLTDIHVRQGESLGGPDGIEQAVISGEMTVIPYLSHGILGESVKSRTAAEPFVQGVTDFPRPGPTAAWNAEQPRPVINYLSHGMAADGEVGARPDDRADRFTPGDGVSTPRVEVAGSSRDWDGLLTIGLGAVALGLALGLAFGYLRRPRLAL